MPTCMHIVFIFGNHVAMTKKNGQSTCKREPKIGILETWFTWVKPYLFKYM